MLVFVGFVLDSFIAFFAKVIAARYLGRVDYGSVAIGITILSIVGAIVILGIPSGISRFLPRTDDPDRKRGIIVSAFQIVLPFSILIAVILFLSADFLAEHVFSSTSVAPVIRIFAIAIPFTSITKLAIGSVRGEQKTVPKIIIQNLSIPLSRLLLVIVAVTIGLQAVGVAWAYTAARIFGAVLGVYFLLRYTPLLSGYQYVAKRKELLTFSTPLVVSTMTDRILTDLDTLLIGALGDLGSVGVYNVAYSMATLLMMVLISFDYLVMPILSRYHSESAYAEMRLIYRVTTKWIFFGTLPLFLGMFLFPELIIGLAFGAEYIGGATALRILAVGFVIHALLGPNAKALTAIGSTKFIMLVNIVVAGLNVLLNLALIPMLGIVGAAVATFVSYTALNVMLNGRLYQQIGIIPFSRELIYPSVVTIGLLGATYLVLVSAFSASITMLGVFLIGVISYPVVIVAFGGIGQTEVMIIDSVEDRFDVDLGSVKRVAQRLA
jgi:O-antigen/teichoic acid export membrane protein